MGLYDQQKLSFHWEILDIQIIKVEATCDRNYLVKKSQDKWCASDAIVVSTPFAMSELLTPEIGQ
jgi:hypothetical protein